MSEIESVLELRRKGMSRKEISSVLSIKLSRVKTILMRVKSPLDQEARQKNIIAGIRKRYDSRLPLKMIELAANLGGQFIGLYQGYQEYCLWKCKDGHLFSRRPFSVIEKDWCPVCMKKDLDIATQICQDFS